MTSCRARSKTTYPGSIRIVSSPGEGATLEVSDRVAFLDEGVVRFDGKLEDAMNSDDRLVRAFVRGGLLR